MREHQTPQNTTRPTPTRRLRRAAAAAVAGSVLVGAAAAPASAATTSLDAVGPVAISAQGQRAAWLRPTSTPTRSGAVRSTQIVVADRPGAAPRTLPVTVPDYADDINVGTDAQGRVVLVVGARSGYRVIRADGTGGLAKIRGLTSKDAQVVMRTGAIAFVRTSGGSSTVRTAPAPGRRSAALYRVPKEYSAVQLALGVRGAVALHAERPRDVGIGDIVWLLRPGKDVKRLTSQSTGGASENGIGGITSSANGTRFGVNRWNVGGGHPNDVQLFSSATGKRTQIREATVDPAAEAVAELLLDGDGSVITSVEDADCTAPGAAPQAGTPACLGVGLVD